MVSTPVDASTRGRTLIVPGRIVGTPPGAAVDTLHVSRGGLPHGGWVAGGRAGAQLRPPLRPPGQGALTLAGGRRVTYSGQVLAPEYFVVTAPGADFGAEAAFAVVFAPLRTAQALTGQPGRVNELVVRLRPGADPASVRAGLARALARRCRAPASPSPRAIRSPRIG